MAHESIFHAAPIDLLRDSPRLVLDLWRLARGELSLDAEEDAEQLEVTVVDPSAIDVAPSHRSADFVALLREGPESPASVALVVEVQRRVDEAKRWAWPQILATLAARHRAPAMLVVLCFDESTARWARELDAGGSLRLEPYVLGPRELPHLGSIERARRHVDLAVLIGLARAANPSAQARGTMGREALDDLLAAVASVSELEDHRRRDALAWLLRSTAPSGVRATIERLLEVRDMRFVELLREEVRQEGRQLGLEEGRQQGLQEGRQEGRQEGLAEALLLLVRKRGFRIDEALEQRVRSTSDVALLDRWLERVLDARSLAEVFGD
jgi:hypothetical protein